MHLPTFENCVDGTCDSQRANATHGQQSNDTAKEMDMAERMVKAEIQIAVRAASN